MDHVPIYQNLYLDLKTHLLQQKPSTTRDTTKSIKEFFNIQFGSDYQVMCSREGSSEYLIDLVVLDFQPKAVIRPRTLDLLPSSISAFMAVESELGGTGASSAYGVMKNVVEDYLKLLLIQSRYKVMIFTSLPYAKEAHHVAKRVETLRELYKRTPGLTSGMLLVHIEGRRTNSTQVQVSVKERTLSGYVISNDGLSSIAILEPGCELLS